MSQAMDLKETQCGSTEKTMRKRRLLFPAAVHRTDNERFVPLVMLWAMSGGRNLGPSPS